MESATSAQDYFRLRREAREEERELITLRDRAAELERAIELVAGDASSGLDFAIAESSAQQAEEADRATREGKRLNLLAAFFFPLLILVVLFGVSSPRELVGLSGFCIWRAAFPEHARW